MFIARNYPFGTALRMGPGYFPMLLGGLLILFGLTFSRPACAGREKIAGSWSLRALVILPLSLVLFGVLMERARLHPGDGGADLRIGDRQHRVQVPGGAVVLASS